MYIVRILNKYKLRTIKKIVIIYATKMMDQMNSKYKLNMQKKTKKLFILFMSYFTYLFVMEIIHSKYAIFAHFQKRKF